MYVFTFILHGVLPTCMDMYQSVSLVLGEDKRALGPLELELALSHHVSAGVEIWSTVDEQPVLLTTEPSLQP